MVKCTGRGLVVKRPGGLSKVQMLNLVLGVGVFSLLPMQGSAKVGPTGFSEGFADRNPTLDRNPGSWCGHTNKSKQFIRAILGRTLSKETF